MARYIDANDFKMEMAKYLPEDRELALKVLKSIKTADVIPVVRCRECKYSLEDKLFGGLWCQHPTENHCERSADFYCGSGERREDG